MIYAAGCTRDQGGLPYHISTEEEIITAITKTLKLFLHNLPPPVLITVARSTDDGYCPPDQVRFNDFGEGLSLSEYRCKSNEHAYYYLFYLQVNLIQTLVLQTVKDVFETDDPYLHYENTSS